MIENEVIVTTNHGNMPTFAHALRASASIRGSFFT
jgi:hypothetical protein